MHEPPPLTLADPGLEATDEGYAYVLSHAPTGVQLEQLLRLIATQLPDAEPGLDRITFGDLTDENRPEVESTLKSILVDVVQAVAEDALAQGGALETGADMTDAPDAVTAIDDSFDALPDELPAAA